MAHLSELKEMYAMAISMGMTEAMFRMLITDPGTAQLVVCALYTA